MRSIMAPTSYSLKAVAGAVLESGRRSPSPVLVRLAEVDFSPASDLRKLLLQQNLVASGNLTKNFVKAVVF